MTLSRLLIVAPLSLVFAAPCFAQPIELVAMSKCAARNIIPDPSCVHEQTGRPFAPWDGPIIPAFDHWPVGCLGLDLNHYQVWTNSPCSSTPTRWMQSPEQPWEPWGGLTWHPDGTLREVWFVGCRRAHYPEDYGIGVGQWSSTEEFPLVDGRVVLPPRIEGTPTWDEFRAGAPVTITLDWQHCGDWMMIGNEPYTDMALFIAAYGFDPRDALLTVTVDYLGDVEPMWWDPSELLGSWVHIAIDVSENPERGDWDRDGAANVPDVFDFLGDWFADDARAGLCDGCSGCTPADIFAFLTDWFNAA